MDDFIIIMASINFSSKFIFGTFLFPFKRIQFGLILKMKNSHENIQAIFYGEAKKEECRKEFEEAKELLEKENWRMELEKWKMEYLEKRRKNMEIEQKKMMERIGQYEHCESMALATKLEGEMVDVFKMEAQIWKEVTKMEIKINY